MSTYLLIHGAWHGGWCWHKVVPRLEKLGHRVLAPDLPSLGRDKTPVNRVSLPLWRDFVCELIDAQREPVILVGHSRGGIVVSEVAEHRPDRIRTLVYLTAFLPRDGESLFDLAAHATDSQVPPSMVMSEDKSSSIVRDEAIRSAFYGECSDDDVALARACLQPEPTLPLATPVHLTEANFGRVPRVYIQCLRDRAVTPAFAKQMIAASPCERVLTIDTDHSPFFSRPDETVAHLHSLGE
jgi:pimeloyl-ACP methyl ester carboxylesterase